MQLDVAVYWKLSCRFSRISCRSLVDMFDFRPLTWIRKVIQKFKTIKLPITYVRSPEAEQSGTQIVNTIDFSVSP